MPRLPASDWLIKTTAAAPSFIPTVRQIKAALCIIIILIMNSDNSWIQSIGRHLTDVISVYVIIHKQTLKPEAFPGVTVPLLSLMKQGLSLDMLSMLLPWRGNSSTFTSTGPEGQRKLLKCKYAEGR